MKQEGKFMLLFLVDPKWNENGLWCTNVQLKPNKLYSLVYMLMMAMYDEVVGISLVLANFNLIVEVPGFTWCLLCRIGLLLVIPYNLHLIVKFRVCRLSWNGNQRGWGRKNRQKKSLIKCCLFCQWKLFGSGLFFKYFAISLG